MLQSNEPYFRVDNSIGNGIIYGTLAGAAGMGITQGIMNAAAKREYNRARDAFVESRLKPRLALPAPPGSISGTSTTALVPVHQPETPKVELGPAQRRYAKMFRGWKGKGLAYGGAMLAGGLLGAAVDVMND
jgi:hypothetical protein